MFRSSLVCSMLLVSVMTGSAGLVEGATSTPSPGKPMPSMEQMDSHMQKMQSLHEKMQKAASAEERGKLVDEHRQAMREGMAMMEPMMGSGGGHGMLGDGQGMMGGGGQGMMGRGGQGMMGGADRGSQAKSTPDGPSMELMHRRIDMMQMMMQMMMDGMMGTAGTPRAK